MDSLTAVWIRMVNCPTYCPDSCVSDGERRPCTRTRTEQSNKFVRPAKNGIKAWKIVATSPRDSFLNESGRTVSWITRGSLGEKIILRGSDEMKPEEGRISFNSAHSPRDRIYTRLCPPNTSWFSLHYLTATIRTFSVEWLAFWDLQQEFSMLLHMYSGHWSTEIVMNGRRRGENRHQKWSRFSLR